MGEDKKLTAKVEKIAKEIEGLTAVELSELASYLEDKFGVSAMPTAAVPAQGSAAPQEGTSPDKEEKTSFTVVLTEGGANKLTVIKAVREILPNVGLIEAKKMVEAAPKEILTNVKKAAAEEARKKLEAAGGKVEIK